MKIKRILLALLVCILVAGVSYVKDKTTSIIPSISTQDENSAQISTTSTNNVTSNVIVMDAGHGGYDVGSISYDGTYEKEITLAIANKVGAMLQLAGYEVVYTRTSDTVSWSSDNKDDLRTRIHIAESANAAYFISIHTNASEQFNDGAYGFETYIDYSNQRITNMAQQIQDNLASLQYSFDRGLKSTEDYPLYVIDQNDVPAMLIEVGFITDSEEASYMSSATGQHNIAQAIADGILISL